MKLYEDLLYTEKFDLDDFWRYCNNIEDAMIEKCNWGEGEEKKLPLSNRMICYAFAASSFNDHKKRIDRENKIEEISEEFESKNKGLQFHSFIEPGFGLFDLFWICHDSRLPKILTNSGIDTVEKLLSSEDKDLTRIRGIGKTSLHIIHYCQMAAKAYIAFFKEHESFYAKEND